MAILGFVAVLVLLAPLAGVAVPGVSAQPAAQTLTFAGCDANLPLTRLLARAFMEQHPNLSIRLQSVGSTNGVALASAGIVDIGLVSRPLRTSEQESGLTFRPYARTAVVIAADPDLPDTTLAARDLLNLYRGTTHRWASGRPVALLTREQGDSSIVSLRERLSGFAEAYAAGAGMSHWTVLYSEPAMHEALLTLPFALGLTDLGTIVIERLPIRTLAIDGIAPTLDNVAQGRYRFTKTLGFVWREGRLPDSARAFVEFVASTRGSEILTSHGYLPVR